MKKKKKQQKKKNTIIIILIIIILLLLGTIIYLLNQNKKIKNLPCNIDIFEIECIENCDSINPSNPPKEQNDNTGSSNTTTTNTTTETPQKIEISDPGIIMYDNAKIWSKETQINIFKGRYKINENQEIIPLIAPEDTDTYEFAIKNKTNNSVEYNVIFKETNENNINMKYRLKQGNKYVVGNENKWVTADEIKLYDVLLDGLQEDTYYLEWKWFSSDNDTEIGSMGNAKYSINISITAEEVND